MSHGGSRAGGVAIVKNVTSRVASSGQPLRAKGLTLKSRLEEDLMISSEMELDEAVELSNNAASNLPCGTADDGALAAVVLVPPSSPPSCVCGESVVTAKAAEREATVPSRQSKARPPVTSSSCGVTATPLTSVPSSSPAVDSSATAATPIWSDTSDAQLKAEFKARRHIDFHPMILCPLQNLGNTCYFNAGLQLLANCPALVYALRHSPLSHVKKRGRENLNDDPGTAAGIPTMRLCRRGGVATHALFEDFADLLSRMETDCAPGDPGLSPVRTLDSLARVYPQFEGRSQQDASEMMTSMLSSLEEEGGQYADCGQLLRSFRKDAEAQQRATLCCLTSAEAAVNDTLHPSTIAGHRHPTATTTTVAVATVCAEESHDCESRGCTQYSPLSSEGAEASLPGPRSVHFMALLRLMEQVNQDNEALERLVKQRQGKPYTGGFVPPRVHFSPLLDSFRGYALSEVTCHSCRAVSRTVSAYNGLMLDIPTPKQRRWYAEAHPEVLRRFGPDGCPRAVRKPRQFTWWNVFSIFLALWERLKHVFIDPFPYPLWLAECLDIHFAPDVLSGPNKYRCESCGTASEATKQETLLSLPEYLLIHLKRFEAGRFFHRKKMDSVFFPASWTPLTEQQAREAPPTSNTLPSPPSAAAPPLPEFLDLRRYLHSSMAPYAAPLPPCLATAPEKAGSRGQATTPPSRGPATSPRSSERAGTADEGARNGAAACPIITTYTLDGIVNHHGGFDGGHYTVFLHKATEERQVWVYISDSEVEEADNVVASDTEYVLQYRRQSLVQVQPDTDEREHLRRKACYYLTPSADRAPSEAEAGEKVSHSPFARSSSDVLGEKAPVYISRLWLQRVAFMHEPGPIVNHLCYCRPEELKRLAMYQSTFPPTVRVPEEVPHVHGPPVEWFYVPITPNDYDIFYAAFGGNVAVTALEYEALREAQVKFCAELVAAERHREGSGRRGSRHR